MTKDRAKIKAAQYLEWAQKAEAKSKEIYANWNAQYKDFDWTQPILRGHHSQKRHEKIYERRDTMHRKINELDAKAKRFREKADNLLRFANTNKGDAERKREAQRQLADSKVSVGTQVYDYSFGSGKILKINKKTYTIQFDRGFKGTRDKSYIKI